MEEVLNSMLKVYTEAFRASKSVERAEIDAWNYFRAMFQHAVTETEVAEAFRHKVEQAWANPFAHGLPELLFCACGRQYYAWESYTPTHFVLHGTPVAVYTVDGETACGCGAELRTATGEELEDVY